MDRLSQTDFVVNLAKLLQTKSFVVSESFRDKSLWHCMGTGLDKPIVIYAYNSGERYE
jgi:hypothetical protein